MGHGVSQVGVLLALLLLASGVMNVTKAKEASEGSPTATCRVRSTFFVAR